MRNILAAALIAAAAFILPCTAMAEPSSDGKSCKEIRVTRDALPSGINGMSGVTIDGDSYYDDIVECNKVNSNASGFTKIAGGVKFDLKVSGGYGLVRVPAEHTYSFVHQVRCVPLANNGVGVEYYSSAKGDWNGAIPASIVMKRTSGKGRLPRSEADYVAECAASRQASR